MNRIWMPRLLDGIVRFCFAGMTDARVCWIVTAHLPFIIFLPSAARDKKTADEPMSFVREYTVGIEEVFVGSFSHYLRLTCEIVFSLFIPQDPPTLVLRLERSTSRLSTNSRSTSTWFMWMGTAPLVATAL